jgi:hypothetical protein
MIQTAWHGSLHFSIVAEAKAEVRRVTPVIGFSKI